ncbi:unnamed protein product [Urochloa humidicola]
MAMNPSDVAFQAALKGNLRLLKQMASKIDLHEVKHPNIGGTCFTSRLPRIAWRSAGSWWKNQGSMSTALAPNVRRR